MYDVYLFFSNVWHRYILLFELIEELIFDLLQVDISTIAVSSFSGPEGQFDIDVFDSTSDYIKLMKYVLLMQDFPFMVLSIYSEECFWVAIILRND